MSLLVLFVWIITPVFAKDNYYIYVFNGLMTIAFAVSFVYGELIRIHSKLEDIAREYRIIRLSTGGSSENK